jgi:UDP-glucuronate decarboxylase
MYNGIPLSDFKEIAEQMGDWDNSAFSRKTVLILGGSGFLGTMFKIYFLYLNKFSPNRVCKIISVDNYLGRSKPNEIEDPNLVHINHDLTLPLQEKLPHGKIDFIINCSGCASPSYYATYPLETMDVSTVATRHLLQLAYSHNAKIVNFSSSEVVGDQDEANIPSNELVIPRVHTLNVRAPYDVTKMFIETLCWVYKEKRKVDVKVIRPFNVTGYFRQDDYRVMPNFVSKVLKNQEIQVYAPGTQTRTFCWYGDFIVGTLKVLLNGTDFIYNIGNQSNEISMVDLARLVEKVGGKTGLVNVVPTPNTYKHEPQRRCPDISKIKEELDYEPRIQLPEMVKRIYNWAKDNYV